MNIKVLLTGFTPFGRNTVNPSWEAVKLVQAFDGMELHRLEIPTVFGKSAQILEEALENIEPDLVLCIGLAAARDSICLERIAVNISDAKSPDNEGNVPHDKVIRLDGPAAYWSNLPCEKLVVALEEEDIPARLSFSAGTFVCNHVFYSLMYLIDTKYPQMTGGLAHIPSTTVLPLDTVARGLEVILRLCCQSR
ncbi:MAG: pyroglutamyl-peptidase I [Victivallales bacterium]|nr:pyroglutamyl-peptidase I [Victivallales bacterium]